MLDMRTSRGKQPIDENPDPAVGDAGGLGGEGGPLLEVGRTIALKQLVQIQFPRGSWEGVRPVKGGIARA